MSEPIFLGMSLDEAKEAIRNLYAERDALKAEFGEQARLRDIAAAENVALKQQAQSADGLTETFKARLKEAEAEVERLKEALKHVEETAREFVHLTSAPMLTILGHVEDGLNGVAVNRKCSCNCHNQPSSKIELGLNQHKDCGECAKASAVEAKALEDSEKRVDACTCPHHEKAPHLTSCRCCSGKVNDN